MNSLKNIHDQDHTIVDENKQKMLDEAKIKFTEAINYQIM